MFRPVQAEEGYLPLEDLGLLGGGTTAALVGSDVISSGLNLARLRVR